MPDEQPSRSNQSLRFASRVGLGVLILGVAVGVYFFLYQTRPQVSTTDPEAARPIANVFRAQRVDIQQQWHGYGTAEALTSADVPSRVTATVESIPDEIEPGRRVRQGQVLVQLDDADFQRQVEIAQQRIAEIDALLKQLDVEANRLRDRLALEDSEVAIAQTDYDRQVNLRDRNVVNEQNVDTANRSLINSKRARLQTQEAIDLIDPRRQSLQAQRASQLSQVNLAELNQQRTTITSPIDGVIQSLSVEVGENLTAGQIEPVARIVSLRRIEVPLSLPASARSDVQVGDRLVLRPTGALSSTLLFPGWATEIARIAPEADAATRTFTVFAVLEQAGDEIRLPPPGMFLQGTVYADTQAPRVLVPRSAIRAGRIQIVEGGLLVSRAAPVAFYISGEHPETGLADDQWAVLEESALEPGTLVLVNAASQRPDGTAVQPRLPDGSEPAGNTADAPPPNASKPEAQP